MTAALALTDADLAMIARAKRAFRLDPGYLIAILWAARDRLDAAPKQSTTVPVLPPRSMLDRLTELEPRLVLYVREDAGGCWVWTGALTGSGQPALRLGSEHRVQQVRRWVYEATHETIPGKRRALAGNACRPLCVHPDHCLVLPKGVRTRSLIRSA